MSNCAQHHDYKGAIGYCPRCRIAELQAELAEQKRLAAPLTKALYKEMSERHAAISVQLAALRDENEGLLAAIESLGCDNAELLQEKGE